MVSTVQFDEKHRLCRKDHDVFGRLEEIVVRVPPSANVLVASPHARCTSKSPSESFWRLFEFG